MAKNDTILVALNPAELKLIRVGLRILRDSCEVGVDYSQYEPYGPLTNAQMKRHQKKCDNDLVIIKGLQKLLKNR